MSSAANGNSIPLVQPKAKQENWSQVKPGQADLDSEKQDYILRVSKKACSNNDFLFRRCRII